MRSLCCVNTSASLARCSSLEMSSTWSSLMTEASGTFFKDDSRWVMIWVDCTADWLNFVYSMISRCTRALSLSRFSRFLRSSAKRSSISCRAVFATLCRKTESAIASAVFGSARPGPVDAPNQAASCCVGPLVMARPMLPHTGALWHVPARRSDRRVGALTSSSTATREDGRVCCPGPLNRRAIAANISKLVEYSHFRTIEVLFNIRRGVK